MDGKHTAAVPFVKDKLEARYERSVTQVTAAARQVIQDNGMLLRESTLFGGTNAACALEGKVNQRTVWNRIEPVDANVTSVVVEARNKYGGRDLDLVHDLDKQIALKLVQ